MTELIVDQHTLSDHTDGTKDHHRIYSEAYLNKISQCIKIAKTIHSDYGIDILGTNGNFEIRDEIIHRLDSLSSRYFQYINQNNNTSFDLSKQHDELSKSNLLDNNFNSIIPSNDDNKKIIEEGLPTTIHSIPIQLPAFVEMQLRNNQLLRDAINNYRRHERHSNLSKSRKISSRKTIDEDDILIIDTEPLCPITSEDISNSSSDILSQTKINLISLMKQIHHQCRNKTKQKKDKLSADIQSILESITNEEIIYEYLQNDMKQNHQSKQLRKNKKNQNEIIQILPYENTYGQFYYPDQYISIEKTMIEKIIHGVQAMAITLTNTKDIEDVLNGTIILSDQSSSPLANAFDNKITDEVMNTIQKRFITRKQNSEGIHLRMALNLILVDNRLNGTTNLCRSDSLILSCMLRKIHLCTQFRTLCSYGDVLITINETDYHQIHLRTYKRMSLSSDEFIEIIGELYQTSSDRLETMKYYIQASDVIDVDTNLLHSSISTSKDIDNLIKYILHEDAIREIKQLIYNRKRNNEYKQMKLILPKKLNDLYQPIKKLNTFMSPTQVMTAIRRPYLAQLAHRSKRKAITASDLRAITSQIWLLPENFQTLIAENTFSSEILCEFYLDFHEKEDIDERLNKIKKKLHDHLNSYSCITRVVLKMIVEHSNGTNLTPFLDEFNKQPRLISIIDLFNDLIQSGLISISELIIYSKQDIIIKKSSLLKHFERISFFRKHDADLLAQTTLIIPEDDLIEYLTQRAETMKQNYINCILNTDDRRDFLTKNLIQSTNRLSSLSIHQFIHYFNLDPNCGKIFYWMGLADENIVKTLIETKTFVNEYILDGIYNNFLIRLHDTLESGIYYISAENVINSDNLKNENLCKLGCYLTYEQASILVDFADPEYEQTLLSLISTHDIVSYERLKILFKSNHLSELSTIILQKQEVIECKTLLDSFHQRILFRQKRFERIENLQKLLLSSLLFDQFIGTIPDIGTEYFTRTELDYLEETKLIDIGVLALLLTLPSYNPLVHQHKYQWFHDQTNQENLSNYLHTLDPIIEKYSMFLTIIILQIIGNKERFSPINEILLSNPDRYLSTEEVLKICMHEQILSYEDINRICQETFPSPQISNIDDERLDFKSISNCYMENMTIYASDSILQNKFEQTFLLSIFDYILHFNHQTIINAQLQQLFGVFKPLAIYTAQLLIEKELFIITLLIKIRQQQRKLTIDDLNRYLQSYPIPCRLDIVNELRRLKIISQSLADTYTMNQCYELKSSTPEFQTNFLFYMMIKLIRDEGYIDEKNLEKFLHQYDIKSISKRILSQGFLTSKQILQSTKDFFLQDYLNENVLSSEYKTVIQKENFIHILQTNNQLEFFLNQNLRRQEVVQINRLAHQLNSIKKSKEKVQRKVDHVLSKIDDNTQFKSSHVKLHNSEVIDQQPLLNLRLLRHHYIQAKIPRNQLHLLVEQGGWDDNIYEQFKHEFEIIDSDNSLNLIQYITQTISLLIKENGSIAEKPLLKHFQEHQILFQSDFDFLLNRYGMIALEDLIDLLIVSKLTTKKEMESYVKHIFCLNINKFIEISQSQEDILVKKNDIINNLEKKLCITSEDLSQLLNDVLKLDRLKRIIDLLPRIKNYIHLHPINTFNAVKALKLEFDFNHHDMKFLRDLKLLNDTWYQQYLLSRISETGPIVSEIIDEEQEQDDRYEFKFRSSTDEDFDYEAFNQLFENKELQSEISEQRKQIYLGQIKKRKNQGDLSKSKISIDEDQLQFSLNLEDVRQQKDHLHVIEQFFPEPSIPGPQLLIPNLSEDQKRSSIELNFAKEHNIEDYQRQYEENDRDQRREVRRQTKKYDDIIEEEEEEESIMSETKTEEEQKQSSILEIPSDEDHIDEQSTDISENESKEESVEKEHEETESYIEKHSSEEDQTETKSPRIIVDEKDVQSSELSLSIAEMIPSSFESSLSKSTSIILPNNTENLTTIVTESLKQLTDSEQNSFKATLELLRHNVDQWLHQTLEHNQQINAIDNYHNDQSFLQNQSLTNQLITYFQTELNQFDKDFLSLNLNQHLNHPKLKNLLEQRRNHIEKILEEKRNHQEILQQVQKQITELDQMMNEVQTECNKEEILQRFNQLKENFNQIKNREYLEVQPILGIRLELAIRTLDADLHLIEQILDGKTLADIIPNVSLITTKTSRQPIQSIESEIHQDVISIRDDLSNIANEIKTCQAKTEEKKIPQDLLRIDITERLQAIKQEYSEQKLNEAKIQDIKSNIDKLVELDQQQQPEFHEKLNELHQIFHIQSNEIRKNLSNITNARYHSNHPNIPLNAKLKFLATDTSGTVVEAPLYLVNKQNIPISDELKLIRLPNQSDHFQISNDKSELTIVNKNKIPLSEPITFKQLTSESLEFEYTNDDQRTVQIIEKSPHSPINTSIILNIKPSDILSPNQTLFVVDNNDHLLSQPIQLIDNSHSSLNISELNLATFLYDEKTNEKVLLTPEQYLVAGQQDEFTPRKFLTYIIDKDNIPISEPVQISDTQNQIKHSTGNLISDKLNLFDKRRHELLDNKNEVLTDIFNEYELINSYIQNRLDKLKIEEKIIEQILPILDKPHDHISADQFEYKHEQSNMDYLLKTMKSIVQLDEKLTKYRKSKTIDSLKIEKLENNLIHQLIEISTQLNDQSITKQLQNLTNQYHHTQLLTELQPIILSGIKIRAKQIQKKCENLLINIYQKSNQLIESEQIRLEYIQYLNKRFNEQIEQENNIENFYEQIERMQYDFYQKIVDSSETIELEDLDNEIKYKPNLTQIIIPDYLKTKNDKLIYKFNSILRNLQNELNTIEEYKHVLLNEMNRFMIDSDNSENYSIQQIISLENQIKIHKNEKLLKSIEKFQVLVNKIEIINEENLQYDFLFSKLDRLYENFLNNYQIQLPAKTNIQSIRLVLNNIRKTAKKNIEKYELMKDDLLRKLEVLKKKEELKQRTKIISISEESQLSSLNAFIQQSNLEPINIHHDFYARKIEQITNDFISIFHSQTAEQHLLIMNALYQTLDHLKKYQQNLEIQQIDYENKLKSIEEEISIAREYSMVDSLVREQIEHLTKQQKQFLYQQELIIKMQIIINETYNQLHALLIPNTEKEKSLELFNQIKQRAINTIIQSAEYDRLSKHVSPHLLILHELTSGQEIISLIPPSARNLFQLPIETDIHQELPSETYLLQHQSSAHFQKDFTQQISSLDSKTQILQIEINYLQKQHAEAIDLGDFTQQLAAERAITSKLQAIEHLQEKPKLLDHQESTMSEQSLITNKTDQQIRELLKKHIKSLRKRIRNDKSKLEQAESLDKQTIHSVEDLRQLNNELKKSRENNNRQQQIGIQLQILDKIDQLDTQSIDQNILQTLRKQLYEEQQQQQRVSLIVSSDEKLHHVSQTQVLPISSHILESSFTTVLEETKSKPTLEQTMIPVGGKLLAQTSSIESVNISLVTTDAKELYEELQKIRYSIGTAFEGTQLPSNTEDRRSLSQVPIKSGMTIEHDEEHIPAENIGTIRLPSQYRWRSSSIEAINSSLFPIDNIQDPHTISSPPKTDVISSSLLLVGNAKKYSITETKAKDRQIAASTQQSLVHSQRDYGKVYTRHRLIGVTAPASSIDEENLRNKIKGKTRLVKFERTRQGNTVIHRRVDVPTRAFIIPQQATYEENLQPVPPLIHVNDAINTPFNEINMISFKSTRSSALLSTLDIEKQSSDLNKTDSQSQQSEMILPFHSATILSPIEEEDDDEIETTSGIAFSLTNRDSSTKKYSVDERADIITTDDDDKLSEKSRTIQQTPSSSPNIVTSSTLPAVETTQKQKTDEKKQLTTTTSTISSSLLKDLSSTSNIPKIKTSTPKEQNTVEKKSSKKKHGLISLEQTEDAQPVATAIDESFSTQGFDVESESQQPIPIIPESKVIYHKVGGKLKSSKKKTKKTDANKAKPKTKLDKIKTPPPPEPLVLTPRKAVPFISATKDQQIDVEEDTRIKLKKKKRKRSTKSNRKSTRSRSSGRSKSINKRKKKTKRRIKKLPNVDEKTDNNFTDPKTIKNQDAIVMHLLNVKRFTGPPISAINFDQSRSKYDDIIEISNEKLQQSRIKSLKPMIKKFEFNHQPPKEIHLRDTFDLDKKLFDFNQDTKDIDQPTMFTEYIPDFFNKQAEEKQIRRISLTAIRTNEQLTKRLAPRIPRLYNGWQPNDSICAHTDEFHPLNKYLMSDISYYFDEDFIDESGLFQNLKDLEQFPSPIKQPTQRFRDDYIIKEFFNCWKDYTTEKARIVELRRKRVAIDFREFWFQDAFSDSFYSYFQQPIDSIKKQTHDHQMAYRLHKRLVRTGREQPKETMNEQNRSSFLPILFNLPNNYLDRQGSLTRRRQLIHSTDKNNRTHLIPLKNLLTNHDEMLSLIRERLNFLQINKHTDELTIKQLLINSSLLEQGTIEDLDRLILDYYASFNEQDIQTSSISSHSLVKLPLLKRSSNISKSSHRIETF